MIALVEAGIFGLVVGSFLATAARRIPAGESLGGRSHCESCGADVRPWQNVPVLSYLVLRGRCSSCRERIALEHPLVELVTGALFVAVTARHADGALAVLIDGVLAFSLLCALIDLHSRRIPPLLLGLGLLGGAGGAAVVVASGHAPVLALEHAGVAGGIAFGFLFLMFLVAPRKLGFADVLFVPLIAATSAFAGSPSWARLALALTAWLPIALLWALVQSARAGGLRVPERLALDRDNDVLERLAELRVLAVNDPATAAEEIGAFARMLRALGERSLSAEECGMVDFYGDAATELLAAVDSGAEQLPDPAAPYLPRVYTPLVPAFALAAALGFLAPNAFAAWWLVHVA